MVPLSVDSLDVAMRFPSLIIESACRRSDPEMEAAKMGSHKLSVSHQSLLSNIYMSPFLHGRDKAMAMAKEKMAAGVVTQIA